MDLGVEVDHGRIPDGAAPGESGGFLATVRHSERPHDVLRHEDLTGAILGAAFEVHSRLGPGLLESSYEECLSYLLAQRRIPFARQVSVPLTFGELKLDCGYRLDFLVDGQVVVELKAVDEFLPIHEAQLLTYLRLGGFPVGLMINFNVRRLKEGIMRRVV